MDIDLQNNPENEVEEKYQVPITKSNDSDLVHVENSDWLPENDSVESESEYFGGESTNSSIESNDCSFLKNKEYHREQNANKNQVVEENKEVHTCAICGRMFVGKSSFNGHMFNHKRYTEFQCPKCMFPCRSLKALQGHLKKNHDEKKYKCGICGEKFPVRKTYTRHMSKHKYNKAFECPECRYPCKSLDGVDLHLKRMHNEKWKEKYEHKRNERRKQMLQEFEQSGHICEICKRRFTSIPNFEKHLLDHEKYKKFACSKCSYPFPSKSALESHVNKNRCPSKTNMTYKCSFCEKSYTGKINLENHEKSVHHKIAFRHVCEICGYGTHVKKNMDRHRITHSNLKGFVCELCGMGYKCKISLKRHMIKSHCEPSSEVKAEFKCRYCVDDDNVVFPCRTILYAHLKDKHRDMYTHRCDQCNNSYMTDRTLKMHKKIVHGNCPAACQFCDRVLTNRYYLYRHYNESCKKKPPGFKYSYPRPRKKTPVNNIEIESVGKQEKVNL